MLASDTTVVANNEHSLTLNQIDTKLHTEGPYTSVPFNWYIMSGFEQKILQDIWKD